MVPAWVADYVGIPYLKGGRTRAGADCLGVLALVQAERFGRRDVADYDGPLFEDYRNAESIGRAVSAFAERFATVPAGEEQEGDVILFRMLGAPLHVACVVARGFMLHGQPRSDSCVVSYQSAYWRRRIVDFYRAVYR